MVAGKVVVGGELAQNDSVAEGVKSSAASRKLRVALSEHGDRIKVWPGDRWVEFVKHRGLLPR